ncbi:MAG: PEGA domain-containing protein [Acidobacteria bacterium]|nr:MAG: PEGA domain-containing protein [Acidobacteriota bacterium]
MSIHAYVHPRSRVPSRALAVAVFGCTLVLALPSHAAVASQAPATGVQLAAAAAAPAPYGFGGHVGLHFGGHRGHFGHGHFGHGHFGHGRFGHHGHHRYYGHSYFPRFSFYVHGYPYYGYRHGYGYRYPYRYGRSRYAYGVTEPLGGIDVNVRPKKAEVYVDGRYVGTADQFDGYPGYLWLEKGTYELAIYQEGYRTLEREIAVYPGVVIRLDERLAPGESVPPEPPPAEAPGAGPSDEPRPPSRPATGDAPGRLLVAVEPADAAVYLDGHFLGAAEELGHVTSGLLISPGDHTVEVVRPGYRSVTRTIALEPGERFELALVLKPR